MVAKGKGRLINVAKQAKGRLPTVPVAWSGDAGFDYMNRRSHGKAWVPRAM
jgi:hypothetical protein